MSDDNNQAADARRRRVQRLKKCIISMILSGVTIPFILCIVLLVRVNGLDRALDSLTGQVQELTELVRMQQEQLGQLTAEAAATGQGSLAESESGRETDGQIAEVITEKKENGQASAEEAAPEITAAHKVYLTFDDGPSTYTDEILDILDRYQVKATFFVVGKDADYAEEAIKDIVDRGHSLGMHSYSHKYSEIYSSVEDFAADFTKLQDYLYEVTGEKIRLYRFPGGSSNTVSRLDMTEFADYLEEQNVTFFDWNISSGDAEKELLSVEELTRNSLAGIEKFGTSVILLHDSAGKRTTVEALPIIIENILAMEDTVILPITEDTEPVQHIY